MSNASLQRTVRRCTAILTAQLAILTVLQLDDRVTGAWGQPMELLTVTVFFGALCYLAGSVALSA